MTTQRLTPSTRQFGRLALVVVLGLAGLTGAKAARGDLRPAHRLHP